jgi:hypothetical protein
MIKRWIWLLALICVGCAPDAPVIVRGATTGASAPTTSAARALAMTIDHDGLYKVGTDIAAGNWHTDGGRRRVLYNPDGSQADVDSRCHWAVGSLATQNGHPFLLKVTAKGDEPGPQDAVIAQGDDAFQTLGCRDWHLLK